MNTTKLFRILSVFSLIILAHGNQLVGAQYELRGAGSNRFGQLGFSGVPEYRGPVHIADNIALTACGISHSLFVTQSGELYAMGYNSCGQLGDGSNLLRTSPVHIASNVAQVYASDLSSLYITRNGDLYGMGYNWSGQLGDGSGSDQFFPVHIASNICKAAASRDFSLMLDNNGNLYGTGSNLDGVLCTGNDRTYLEPVFIARGVVDIAAGENFILVLFGDGSLYGAGQNNFGQLGLGDLQESLQLIFIASGIRGVAAGRFCGFYFTRQNELYGFGQNSYGQLGCGDRIHKFRPVLIGRGIESVCSSGFSSFCMTGGLGGLYGMGDDSYGQLDGHASHTPSLLPRLIAGNVMSVSVSHDHSMYVDSNRSLFAMGANDFGQLGDGFRSLYPEGVDVGRRAVEVSCGYYYTLFRTAQGELYAMGENYYGSLGDGTYQNRSTPVKIAPGSDPMTPLGRTKVARLATGGYSSYFITTEGILCGMGDNSAGQLGIEGAGKSNIPVWISDGVKDVRAGPNHVVFIKNNGDLYGLGANMQYQLGIGYNSRKQETPVKIASHVKYAACGDAHTIFVDEDGFLYVMGSNQKGQLGVGEGTVYVSIPSMLVSAEFRDIVEVAAGSTSSYVLTGSGELYATGENSFGQLGIGNDQTQYYLIHVASHVAHVIAGGDECYYIDQDGVMFAMGSNDSGSFGNGTFYQSWHPEKVADDVEMVSAGLDHMIYIKAQNVTDSRSYNIVTTTATNNNWSLDPEEDLGDFPRYSVVGSLPKTLSISDSFIQGRVTKTGEYSFSIVGSDKEGDQVTSAIRLKVIDASKSPLILGVMHNNVFKPSEMVSSLSKSTSVRMKTIAVTVKQDNTELIQLCPDQTPSLQQTYVLSQGNLPDGMLLRPNGCIMGVPQTLGLYNFTVSVTDSRGTGSQSFVITVE